MMAIDNQYLYVDGAPKYMLESYIQHNPNVPTGRTALIEFFSKMPKPKPIEPLDGLFVALQVQ